MARDRVVAGSLFHRNFRYQQGGRRLEAQIHPDRPSSRPLQWALPRLDRNVLDANERNTGAVSNKTRARVKIDLEQRIRTGKFRRKISGST